MTAHATSRSASTFSIDDRVLTAIAVIGVLALLLPAVAPLATGNGPGYYLVKKYGTSDNADKEMRDDGTAAGGVGSAMATAGGVIMKSTSATVATYAGGAMATGGAALVVAGTVLLG